jgi:hypothetical protein
VRRTSGRPPRFSDDVAWKLTASILAGNTISDAEAEIGVSRRRVQLWRRRAWSQRPEDEPYVRLEQAIERGFAARAEIAERPVALQPLDDLLADLDDAWT